MGTIPRMIKPFICFFILFLSILINYQGSGKTYLAQTSDGNDDEMSKSNKNEDYYYSCTGDKGWKYNLEYRGYNLATRYASNAWACCRQCKQDSRCTYFTYKSRTRSCEQKSRNARKTTNRDATSGYHRCC